MDLLNTIIGIVAIICAIWVIYDVLLTTKIKTGLKIFVGSLSNSFSIIAAIVYFIMYKMKEIN